MIIEQIYAAQQIGFPILSALIFLPLALMALLRFVRQGAWVYRVGIAGAALELALSALLLARFQRGVSDLQFVERVGLFAGLSYHVGVDGISVLFLPFTALLTLLVAVYAQQVAKAEPARYLMAIFGLTAVLMGAFVSLDLRFFWLFSALELVPGSILIRRWGTGPKRALAARRYLLFNLTGVALMLLGIVVLGSRLAGLPASAPGGAPVFDLVGLLQAPLPLREQTWVFFLFFLALSVRVPLFPFHGWLSVALEEGPVVGVSVFLVGVKLGAYGLLRFVIPLVPDAAREWCWLVVLVGGIGVVYGALLALIQTDLRRMLSFACLSHMGGVMVGLFSLNKAGITGGLLSILNVGIATAGLFFITGFLYNRLGSSELARFGGLSHYLPLLSLTFLVVALAFLGMPGTTGFDAEHLVIEGALDAHHWVFAVLAGVDSLLAAAYLFRYYQRAFLGASHPEGLAVRVPDLRVREFLIAACVTGLILGLGIFSRPILSTVSGSVEALSERVEHGAIRDVMVTRQQGSEGRRLEKTVSSNGRPL